MRTIGRKGKTVASGYGSRHQRRRRAGLPQAYGQVCFYCGELMQFRDELDWDHACQRITHASCIRRAAARFRNAA